MLEEGSLSSHALFGHATLQASPHVHQSSSEANCFGFLRRLHCEGVVDYIMFIGGQLNFYPLSPPHEFGGTANSNLLTTGLVPHLEALQRPAGSLH